MKRLLLIVSPYFIFCLLFSFLFIFKPSRNKENGLENTKDSVIVVPPTIQDEVIDSLSNLESELESQLEERNEHLNTLKEQSDFKLIVGSFKSESKAKQLVSKLINDGFDPILIKENNLIRVGAGFSYDMKELDITRMDLESKGYKTWILKNS